MTDWVGLGWHILAFSLKREGHGEEDEELERGHLTITPNWVISFVISHGECNRSKTINETTILLGNAVVFNQLTILNSPGSCGVKL